MENLDILVPSTNWLPHPHGINTNKSLSPISELMCCECEDTAVAVQMHRASLTFIM